MATDIFEEMLQEKLVRRIALQGLGLSRTDPAYPRQYQRLRIRVPRLTQAEMQIIERRQREVQELVLDMLKMRKPKHSLI